MSSPQRFMLFAGLLLLTGVIAVFVLGRSGPPALAAAGQMLGPADAVRLVDGQSQISLQNRGGRPAWGDSAFRQAYALAFADVNKIFNRLIDAPELVQERQKLQQELQQTEADYRTRLNAYQEQLQDQNSPEFQEKFQEAQKLYEEVTKWREGAVQRQQELAKQQIGKANRDMMSAVDVVSQRLGIDIVLGSVAPEEDFQSQEVDQALFEIRLRHALKYPKSLDITEHILKELGINAEAPKPEPQG